MKKLTLLIATLAIGAGLAGQAAASSIAAKVWYADLVDNEDPAFLYGGSVSLSLSEDLWISGLFLTGTYKDVYGLSGIDYDTMDAEAVLGMSFSIFDIGIGARYSTWTLRDEFDNELELVVFGPMAYVGLGNTFGDSPIGWYVGGSYMFKDFGDADDVAWAPGFEHYNVEGGLFLALDPLTATVGYRIKEYLDYDDISFKGVTASVGFGF